MEALAIILALILIALIGGAAFVFREAGQQLVSGDHRRRIDAREAEARERADALREIHDDYRRQLGALQERRLELEAAFADIRANDQMARRDHDQLIERLRRTEQQLEARAESLREREEAAAESARAAELQSATPVALPAGTIEEAPELMVRRAEITAELYDRLARVEFSIVSLTNPILLPGESFRVPTDLTPELLRWENWREVGETAFQLGEYFNQHRIHLDQTTARAVEACIATIRTTLTQDIYPVLSETADADQQRRIRESLETLGIIPRLRRYMEAQYRSLVGIADPDEDDPTPPSPDDR